MSMETHMNIYFAVNIQNQTKIFKSLQHLGCLFRIGQCHPIAKTCTANRRDISRIPLRLKIATGSYILQTKRAVFNKDNGNANCKQEVGIWRVKKRFPRYGVPIWSLWPNIRFLPSIVAEKNVTKNVHICSMCIETN